MKQTGGSSIKSIVKMLEFTKIVQKAHGFGTEINAEIKHQYGLLTSQGLTVLDFLQIFCHCIGLTTERVHIYQYRSCGSKKKYFEKKRLGSNFGLELQL